MLSPVVDSEKFGNASCKWIGVRSTFVFLFNFSMHFTKVDSSQVGVKALLVYASDEAEGLEKKTKVSALMNARHALVTLEPSRSQYSVNSEHVQDSSTKIFCLCLVTHMVSA